MACRDAEFEQIERKSENELKISQSACKAISSTEIETLPSLEEEKKESEEICLKVEKKKKKSKTKKTEKPKDQSDFVAGNGQDVQTAKTSVSLATGLDQDQKKLLEERIAKERREKHEARRQLDEVSIA